MADFTIKSGDTLPYFATIIQANGTPVNLTGCTINFALSPKTNPTIQSFFEAATIVNAATGEVRYEWQPGETDVLGGLYLGEWQVEFPTGDRRRFPTVGYFLVDIQVALGTTPPDQTGQTVGLPGPRGPEGPAGPAGPVTGVTGTAPITSTGGAAPVIGITAATTLAAGSMSAADKILLDSLSAGTVPSSRTLTAGTGMTGGGDLSSNRTFNVAANADGSIVANADDIQVGVLATNTQHGNRGGGGLHADVVSSGPSGFMTGADKAILDGLSAGSVPTSRTLTAGAGLTGGGDLSANRTFTVGANVDGSIAVNADDLQVGVLATDAQHGVRGGGTQHAAVVAAGASGFMIGSDKTKLDGIAASAAALTSSAPANVTKSAAVVGVDTTAARSDHKHDISTASASNVSTSNTEGTATSLARSDHTHNLPFTPVQTALAAASGDVSVNSQRITNGITPISASEFAIKGYVDTMAAGLTAKGNCRVLATTNITLSGTQTIDGVSVISGNRVYVIGQTSAIQNGIYVVAAGAWARSTDMAAGSSATGVYAFVSEGSVGIADTGWICTTNPPSDVVGTDALAFTQFSAFALATSAPENVTKAAAVIGTSGRAAREDHKHDVTTATPGTVTYASAAEGTATSLARSDHTHALTSPAAPANVTKAAANAGTSANVAREDHKHDVTTATPGTVTYASAAEGTATSLARSDHTHALTSPAAPANVTKAAASAGSAANVAREDHKHDVTTAAAVEVTDITNAEGTATSLARSDHTHAHGDRIGGTLHAQATQSDDGFMSTADKSKLDQYPGSPIDITHNTLSGLGDDDPHSQYWFLNGRAGQTNAYGGAGAGENLALSSTVDSTKGIIQLGVLTTGLRYYESTQRIALGLDGIDPEHAIDVGPDASDSGNIRTAGAINAGNGPQAFGTSGCYYTSIVIGSTFNSDPLEEGINGGLIAAARVGNGGDPPDNKPFNVINGLDHGESSYSGESGEGRIVGIGGSGVGNVNVPSANNIQFYTASPYNESNVGVLRFDIGSTGAVAVGSYSNLSNGRLQVVGSLNGIALHQITASVENRLTSALMIGSDASPTTGAMLDVVGAGGVRFGRSAATSGSPIGLLYVAAAHTGLTASAEIIDAYWNGGGTSLQRATGAVTAQRTYLFTSRSYSFVGASTITNAATLAVSGAPTAGTNATLTNTYALWVQAGTTRFDGNTIVAPLAASSGVATGLTYTGAAHLSLTASTEALDIDFNAAATMQHATGAITTQRTFLFTGRTYGFVGASTITNAATVAIAAAPIAGTNATLTNAYALWVQAGMSRFDGNVNVVPAIAASGSTTGISYTGAAHTAQSASVEVNDVLFNCSATLQHTVGSYTTQRTVRISPRTYSFTSGSTVTTAATLAVDGPPVAGSNAVLTNAYSFWVGAGASRVDTQLGVNCNPNASAALDVRGAGGVMLARTAATSGVAVGLQFTGAAHTAQTLSTEVTDLDFNIARTVQWATGALTTQRFARIYQPTIGFVGASTVTNAATFSIDGAPVAGTNATLTNAYALWIAAGTSRFDGAIGINVNPASTLMLDVRGTGGVNIQRTAASTGVAVGLAFVGAAHTGQTASTEVTDIDLNIARTVTWATGALANQRFVRIYAPTIAFAGASTVTSAATFSIDGAPVAGTNATLTSSYALWSQGGTNRFDGTTTFGAAVAGATGAVQVQGALNGVCLNVTGSGGLQFARTLATSGTPSGLIITGAAHTGLTASTEILDAHFNSAATLQHATGALATQRTFLFTARTYSFVGASIITDAATLAITNAPIAGTNATIGNTYALWVQAGIARLDGNLGINVKPATGYALSVGGAGGYRFERNAGYQETPKGFEFIGAPHLECTTLTEVVDFDMNTTRNVEWLAGSFATQRFVRIGQPTVDFLATPSTITNIASFAIVGAPIPGSNATFTNTYAMWVQAGVSRFDGGLSIVPTLATSGSPIGIAFTGAAHTGLTASAEIIDVNFDASATMQHATGAITTQRSVVVQPRTYGFVGASTITNAASFAVSGAPVAGTNATITNAYALWVQAGTSRFDGLVSIAPTLSTSGAPVGITYTGPAHTGLTASTETVDVNFNATATLQHATGAITTQRTFLFQPRTYGFVGASTITSAATLAIANAPIAGTNATLTNSYALWVQAGGSRLDGQLGINTAAVAGTNALDVRGTGGVTFQRTAQPVGVAVGFNFVGAAHTGQAASTEVSDVSIDVSATLQHSTGAITTQRSVVILPRTYSFVGASTITDAATFAINGAPIAGTNGTITNSYALWVQSGKSRFQGAVVEDAVISPTAITGAQNDYTPTGLLTTKYIRQDCSAAASLTGLGAGQAGQCITIINIATNVLFTLTLTNEDGASTAANRFINAGGASTVVSAGGSVELWYDPTSTRWRVISKSL